MNRDKLDGLKAIALNDAATLEERRTCALLYLQNSKDDEEKLPCEHCLSKDAMLRFMAKEKSELEQLVYLMSERLAQQREEMDAIRQNMLVGALMRRLRR